MHNLYNKFVQTKGQIKLNKRYVELKYSKYWITLYMRNIKTPTIFRWIFLCSRITILLKDSLSKYCGQTCYPEMKYLPRLNRSHVFVKTLSLKSINTRQYCVTIKHYLFVNYISFPTAIFFKLLATLNFLMLVFHKSVASIIIMLLMTLWFVMSWKVNNMLNYLS